MRKWAFNIFIWRKFSFVFNFFFAYFLFLNFYALILFYFLFLFFLKLHFLFSIVLTKNKAVSTITTYFVY